MMTLGSTATDLYKLGDERLSDESREMIAQAAGDYWAIHITREQYMKFS